jgi:hypothetical protein
MAATLEASYQPLQPYGPELGEPEETPQDSGVMIHVVPENSRGKNSVACYTNVSCHSLETNT